MNWKLIIKYGVISGSIIVSTWIISYLLFGQDSQESGGELFGYLIMLLALTAVFVGIKKEKDKREVSEFSFKDGLVTGLGIVTVASVIYTVGWMIYMPNFYPDFVDNYAAAQITQIQETDLAQEEKQSKIQEVNTAVENYRKPYFMAFITFMEIFPVGLLVALISALILRSRKRA